ncbi:MAG: hypothetical protein AAGM04_05450 [Pseudomonadota bacterium]
MMSQTHVLLAAALFAKPGKTLRNTAVVAGAIVPDIAIFGLLGWSKVMGIPETRVWNELYWQEPWQTYTAAGNSLPLYLLIAVFGVLILRLVPAAHRLGMVALFFALAAITHVAGDLPVHVEDAHRHLWPLSDWKFISPVSYWNPEHHGRAFSVFEGLLGIALSIILFRRFKGWLTRVIIITLIVAYFAVPAYFIFMLG